MSDRDLNREQQIRKAALDAAVELARAVAIQEGTKPQPSFIGFVRAITPEFETYLRTGKFDGR